MLIQTSKESCIKMGVLFPYKKTARAVRTVIMPWLCYLNSFFSVSEKLLRFA